MLHCPAVKEFISKRLKPLAMLVIISLMIGINAIAAPKVHAQDPATELFQLVNNFRVSLGLVPFRWNAQLAVASQNQASWLLANPNNFVHTWPNGTSKETRARAAGYTGRVVENIVGGFEMTPQRALTWWQNSPVHYNTITSSVYVDAGTAFSGSGNQRRYVIVVGLPSGSNPVAAARPPEPETAPIFVEPIIIAEPDENGQILHTIGKGHALWTLAAYYNVKVSDLLLYNDLSENDLVSVGDEIVIQPERGWVPPPTPTPPYSVFVQDGQTLWTIAAIHNISLADLLLFNGLGADTLISKGDEIKIRLLPGEQLPTPTPTATPVQRYTIREGDSAWSISARFGIVLDSLLAWNELPQNPLLSVGQELWVVQPFEAIAIETADPLPAATSIAATPEPTLTVVVAVQSESPSEIIETATPPAEIALAADSIAPAESTSGSADNEPAVDVDVEVVRVADQPDTIVNLPLILGILAFVFLGFGLWLFLQSKKIE